MGLDMYLYRRQEANPEGRGTLQVMRQGRAVAVEQSVPTTQQEQIGYWRKANHIHGWFVDNVQAGEDDCREYDVSRKQLALLLETVLEVADSIKLVPGKVSVGQTLVEGKWVDILEDGLVVADPTIAKDLLPRREGFFFGSYEYNQWYLDDLRETERLLKAALGAPLDAKFSYQSWW